MLHLCLPDDDHDRLVIDKSVIPSLTLLLDDMIGRVKPELMSTDRRGQHYQASFGLARSLGVKSDVSWCWSAYSTVDGATGVLE